MNQTSDFSYQKILDPEPFLPDPYRHSPYPDWRSCWASCQRSPLALIQTVNLPFWMAAPMATASSGLTALLGVLPKISPCPNPDCELPKISPCPDPDCELTLDGGAHGHSLVGINGLAEDLLTLIRIVNLPWMAAPMATASSGLTALLGVLPKISLP